MSANETGYITIAYYFLCIVAVLFLLLSIARLAVFLNDFSRELRLLNGEIARTRGEERKYWQARKKKLWLSLIPFVKY